MLLRRLTNAIYEYTALKLITQLHHVTVGTRQVLRRQAHGNRWSLRRNEATQIIDGQRDGTLWLPGPAGNA
jgi:hypothetical protein